MTQKLHPWENPEQDYKVTLETPLRASLSKFTTGKNTRNSTDRI
ncbi:hypothetical protein ICE98_02020 [Lactococcus lactis]|nr:hypothetical protein [Lactococcus lactis]